MRTRLAEANEWPVDVSLYLELETMHDELSLEGKVNLQKRLGPVRILSNLWAEESFVRPLDTKAHGREAVFIINPTLGEHYGSDAAGSTCTWWTRAILPAAS